MCWRSIKSPQTRYTFTLAANSNADSKISAAVITPSLGQNIKENVSAPLFLRMVFHWATRIDVVGKLYLRSHPDFSVIALS